MRGRRPCAAAWGLCLVLAGSAGAGSLAVNPVRLTLATGQTAAALTVRNDGAAPALVQLETLDWSQQDGSEVLAPSRELLATPPIFTVAPGASQVVRVGLRSAAVPRAVERSFRLLLKEIPPPPQADARGLQMALHLSLPVFLQPVGTAKPILQWEAARQGAQLRLSARNAGNTHVQISKVALQGIDWPPKTAAAYLLAGQRREWLIAREVPVGSELLLTAQTDAGDLSARLVVAAP
ncbi:fimbria/pilus periplasmic chaperone [Xylophilus rhododendri]|uniref:Fimbria/pilus periplasmic chaperone n=1 Tax=Xylophilus rhododendri TaxID=2697032 RepID=A0A857J6X7_9BURK|nr:molecular chaperone [Xylophilus rhododendri]QHI98829.1 fimbria/pilus periplasmic chaperone [Xylophilus rhododendri]